MNYSWAAVWVKPRTTIRKYLQLSSPERHALPIAMLAGIVRALDMAFIRSLDEQYSFPVLVLLLFAGGSIGDLLWLYIVGAILKVTGSWLGGKGSYSDLRTALTRGINVPVILVGILWVPEILLYGGGRHLGVHNCNEIHRRGTQIFGF